MSQAMKKTIGHRGIDPTGETTYKKVKTETAAYSYPTKLFFFFYLTVDFLLDY